MFQKKKKKRATAGGFLSTDGKERLFLSDFKHPAVTRAVSSERHLNPAGPQRKHRYRFLIPPPAFLSLHILDVKFHLRVS